MGTLCSRQRSTIPHCTLSRHTHTRSVCMCDAGLPWLAATFVLLVTSLRYVTECSAKFNLDSDVRSQETGKGGGSVVNPLKLLYQSGVCV